MMPRILLSIALCGVFAVGSASAQQAGTPPVAREYRLQALYRAGIAQNYEIVELTTVERTFSDSSKKTYDRSAQYFVTVRCIESMDGIARLAVNIDSLLYAFNADGKSITYDSQKDITPKNFADLNNFIGPLNRTFELTVSPYGEVSKLSGEQIDFWRDYLEQNAADLDTVVYTIWMQSLDRENLAQYGDLQKRVIPGLRKAVDSTWRHELELRLDGVLFAGRVTSRLAEYSDGLYTLITKDTVAARIGQPVHLYGIPYIASVLAGSAVVDNKLLLTSSGTINEVTCVSNAWIKLAVRSEVFTQRITTTTQWKLTGQYQW